MVRITGSINQFMTGEEMTAETIADWMRRRGMTVLSEYHSIDDMLDHIDHNNAHK